MKRKERAVNRKQRIKSNTIIYLYLKQKTVKGSSAAVGLKLCEICKEWLPIQVKNKKQIDRQIDRGSKRFG